MKDQSIFIQKANTFVNEIKDGNYEASLEADTNNPALNQLKSTFKDLQLALKMQYQVMVKMYLIY